MPGPLAHALKSSALPLRGRWAATARVAYARNYAQAPKNNPIPPTNKSPEPQEHRRSWFYSANKFNQLVVIPSALLYCLFFADFGEHEHVFSPLRRWLDRQKARFFSLSPEEQALVSGKTETDKPTDSRST